ncbi:hypothetical protein F0562_012307 [Nyssa sinensis]|uniref:Uncharacterized protein n=1 Tax=Nyssa sinensis TaxID=561372 RepID=A0A5J4ZUS2_9ASTE|nr:hypothetical protein F0562_012307 [Nyssa sinensis]
MWRDGEEGELRSSYSESPTRTELVPCDCPAVASPPSTSDQASSLVCDIVVSHGPQAKTLKSATSTRGKEIATGADVGATAGGLVIDYGNFFHFCHFYWGHVDEKTEDYARLRGHEGSGLMEVVYV